MQKKFSQLPYDLSQHKQTSNHIIATIANKDGIA